MDVSHLPYSGNGAMTGGSVSPRQLVCLLALRSCGGEQPQRYVGGLHRFPYHPHQFVIEGFEVRLVS